MSLFCRSRLVEDCSDVFLRRILPRSMVLSFPFSLSLLHRLQLIETVMGMSRKIFLRSTFARKATHNFLRSLFLFLFLFFSFSFSFSFSSHIFQRKEAGLPLLPRETELSFGLFNPSIPLSAASQTVPQRQRNIECERHFPSQRKTIYQTSLNLTKSREYQQRKCSFCSIFNSPSFSLCFLFSCTSFFCSIFYFFSDEASFECEVWREERRGEEYGYKDGEGG